jgi:hypothetical protein
MSEKIAFGKQKEITITETEFKKAVNEVFKEAINEYKLPKPIDQDSLSSFNEVLREAKLPYLFQWSLENVVWPREWWGPCVVTEAELETHLDSGAQFLVKLDSGKILINARITQAERLDKIAQKTFEKLIAVKATT